MLPAGRGVGWTVVELVDRDGNPVPEGDVGRVRVRAPSVALGYWGLPRESAAAFGAGPDGLATFLTSDLGRRLPRGDLMVVGRADHAVKIRGYLVDPGEGRRGPAHAGRGAGGGHGERSPLRRGG
jgi:non-ribosomal peptide synthetase component F